jgi:hypothetical protein
MKKWIGAFSILLIMLIGYLFITQNAFEDKKIEEETEQEISKQVISEPKFLLGEVQGISISAQILRPEEVEVLDVGIPEDEIRSNHLIYLKLDTHGGDLQEYDLTMISELLFTNGERITASKWLGMTERNHHRHGVLFFLKEKADSQNESIGIRLKGLYGEDFEGNWEN